MTEITQRKDSVRLVVEMNKNTRHRFKLKAMSENPPKSMKEKIIEFIERYITDAKK